MRIKPFAVCCFHVVLQVNCSYFVRDKDVSYTPNFPNTVELCFRHGPKPFRNLSVFSRKAVKGFIIFTQLGTCCIYFVFVSSTIKAVIDAHGYYYDRRWFMFAMLIPVIMSCFIKSLKHLAPVSLLSNICIASSIFLTLYISSQNLPSVESRKLIGDLTEIPLSLGTIVYAFQGINLILPLQNSMKHPEQFNKPFGVLNLSMSVVMVLLNCLGFVGYLKYGEDVQGSLSLNLPQDILSQAVQITVSAGIMLSYALQFFVVDDLLWEEVNKRFGPFKRPLLQHMGIKAVLVTVTMMLAALVPHLGLIISFTGALASTSLALLFPALCDISLRFSSNDKVQAKLSCNFFRISLDLITVFLTILCFVTGTYTSMLRIVNVFTQQTE